MRIFAAKFGYPGRISTINGITAGTEIKTSIVCVHADDVAGGEWEVDPGLYADLRTEGYKNMDDLVDAVEHVAEEIGEDGNRRSQGE